MAAPSASVTLTRATGATISSVVALLERAGLPTQDVRKMSGCLYLALSDSQRVGTGGVERHGTNGPLRSVVVERAHRGVGVGTAICDQLVATARADGITTLYLLTTTAAEFFAARGYQQVDRERVPAPIRETTQFAQLCPSTAVCESACSVAPGTARRRRFGTDLVWSGLVWSWTGADGGHTAGPLPGIAHEEL